MYPCTQDKGKLLLALLLKNAFCCRVEHCAAKLDNLERRINCTEILYVTV